jgi:hypothetical protein
MSSLSFEKSSLKASQLSAVNCMLSLNDDSASPNNGPYATTTTTTTTTSSFSMENYSNQWKILIYDAPCRSIISPLLSVSQLRQRGVTLHLLISADREPIPDVPAVYFVEPTRANLQIIAQDCANRLYSKVHINFVNKLDRSLMEEFGKLIVQNNCLDMIASLHDQYLDFICLEKRLFSLSNKANSYVMMNGSGVTDAAMETYLNEVAYGLLSVVGTTGSLPVIRCPKVIPSMYVYVCMFACVCLRVYVCVCMFACVCLRVCLILFIIFIPHISILLSFPGRCTGNGRT